MRRQRPLLGVAAQKQKHKKQKQIRAETFT